MAVSAGHIFINPLKKSTGYFIPFSGLIGHFPVSS